MWILSIEKAWGFCVADWNSMWRNSPAAFPESNLTQKMEFELCGNAFGIFLTAMASCFIEICM